MVLGVIGLTGMARVAAAQTTSATCADCHKQEGMEFLSSVHAAPDTDCRACHGGEKAYEVDQALIDRSLAWASQPAAAASSSRPVGFDHGSAFRGHPKHHEIPELCATCHSDVAKMNPYGLPTDQLAQYRLSGHGQALYGQRNDRVAVCTDCHGKHEILRAKNTRSSVHPKNVPATCGHCHGDAVVMSGSNLSTRVVQEYRESVHGKGLLDQSDLGMPSCAGCHGNHSAVPPGFENIQQVCGRCHQQEERFFADSPHAKFPLFPQCVGCHTERVDDKDHLILRVATSPQAAKEAYQRVLRVIPEASPSDPRVQAAYELRREPKVSPFESFCRRCHHPATQVGHRFLFGDLDKRAAQMGEELYKLALQAELDYASMAVRVDDASSRGLMVTDEALSVDEMRTRLVELAALQHTLDVDKVQATVEELKTFGQQARQSLNRKEAELRWRFWGLIPMWCFIGIFVCALWVKYKQLKAAMVAPAAAVIERIASHG